MWFRSTAAGFPPLPAWLSVLGRLDVAWKGDARDARETLLASKYVHQARYLPTYLGTSPWYVTYLPTLGVYLGT